jgi:hypothetical protein
VLEPKKLLPSSGRRYESSLSILPWFEMPSSDLSDCTENEMTLRDEIKKIKEKLNALSDEERLELFSNYCHGCGTKELPCYCTRDE